MKISDILPEKEVLINGLDDLAVYGDIRPFIGKKAKIVKLTKSGMVLLDCGIKVPPRNLDIHGGLDDY